MLDDTNSFRFPGDPAYATQLYRELTGQPVQTDDLRVHASFSGYKRGDYRSVQQVEHHLRRRAPVLSAEFDRRRGASRGRRHDPLITPATVRR